MKVIPEPDNCDAAKFGSAPTSTADGHCRCLVCSRCGHHTGEANQGHYWSFCKVTKTMREFHFCCPDEEHGCELERKPA